MRPPGVRTTRWACTLALSGAIALAAGCATYTRGHLAAAASGVPPLHVETVAEDVTGRSCGQLMDVRFERAVEDALRQAPGANALMDVVSTWESFCVVVRGDAVRLPPGPEPDRGPAGRPAGATSEPVLRQ